MKIHAFLGTPLTNGGPSYTCEQLLSRMATNDLGIHLYAPADRRKTITTSLETSSTLPRSLRKVPYRPFSDILLKTTERQFLNSLSRSSKQPLAYLWGNVSPRLSSAMRQQKAFVIREKYNCDVSFAESVLRHAYRQLGSEEAFPASYYTKDVKDAEVESLFAADVIFCPSPMVARSLGKYGIDEKLAATSYGIDPFRLDGTSRALEEIDEPTFLFVGSICVRKGAHILLKAWKKAEIRGRLVFLGNLEPFIRERYKDVLGLPSVEHHPFASDVGSFYRSADFFVFPSLEEGSPLVSYEAAYCGVPSIVSPMGAGEIIRDGMEGIVIESLRVDDWAHVLIAAADGLYDRAGMSERAHSRACQFTWDKVAAQRSAIIRSRLGTSS